MSNEYDFLSMGMRYAKDGLINLKKEAQEIEKNYGTDARLEFESGIAMAIPAYSEFLQKDVSEKEITNATNDIGVPNTRNNSYFGNLGTSTQYKIAPNGTISYNESTGRSR